MISYLHLATLETRIVILWLLLLPPPIIPCLEKHQMWLLIFLKTIFLLSFERAPLEFHGDRLATLVIVEGQHFDILDFDYFFKGKLRYIKSRLVHLWIAKFLFIHDFNCVQKVRLHR